MDEDTKICDCENLKLLVHSELAKYELNNKCNQLQIEAMEYVKDKAAIEEIKQENSLLKKKLIKLDEVYATQISFMIDTILKVEETSQEQNLKQKKIIAGLEEQLHKVNRPENCRSVPSKPDESDEFRKASLDEFHREKISIQAKRIAELEEALEASKRKLSVYERANIYLSDISKIDEIELSEHLAESSKDAEKFMGTLESLELDLSSDITNLEEMISLKSSEIVSSSTNSANFKVETTMKELDDVLYQDHYETSLTKLSGEEKKRRQDALDRLRNEKNTGEDVLWPSTPEQKENSRAVYAIDHDQLKIATTQYNLLEKDNEAPLVMISSPKDVRVDITSQPFLHQ